MASSAHNTSATDAPPVADGEVAAAPQWAELRRARREGTPESLAVAEDGVFRLYLPLARALASEFVGGGAAAPVEVEWAAELGLAKAVLGWPGDDGRGFESYARTTITGRLCRQVPSPPHHRATAARMTSTAPLFPSGGFSKGR